MGCTVQSMLRSGRSVRILGCEVHSRGRTPHGVRGLKSRHDRKPHREHAGRTPHGVRGLKYRPRNRRQPHRPSHPSRGAWIEIWATTGAWACSRRRTPHGVRGLKLLSYQHQLLVQVSHPSRGAWIEITPRTPNSALSSSRTPHGVRGLKCRHDWGRSCIWVVAPLTGCVD